RCRAGTYGSRSSRPARPSPPVPWLPSSRSQRTSPRFSQPADRLAAFDHLLHVATLFSQRAGGADLDAFAATGARAGLAPRFVQFTNQARGHAARHHVPDVGALDFGADADTARAQDAAVVVEHEARVRGVHGERPVAVGVADVGDAQLLGQRLQLAVVVGDAHGADVVARG